MKTTETVFILDRSGSMSGLEKDTIGGFNSMLQKQKKLPGRAFVTTVLFDDRYELLHDHEDIRTVRKLTEKDYYVRGCTALLDAVGMTVERMLEADRNDQLLFVITTDGYENASRRYDYQKVKKLISRAREMGWEFIFMGANFDSAEVAGSIGIRRSVDYYAEAEALDVQYDAICKAMTAIRSGSGIDNDWDAWIREYNRNRKQK